MVEVRFIEIYLNISDLSFACMDKIITDETKLGY